jgi:hypothetical protein
MTVADVITDLQARGAIFELIDGRIRIDGPEGLVTEEVKQFLSEHKPDIVSLLTDAELRFFLNDGPNALTCACLPDTRRWRHAATKDRPPGFKWHCANCFPPADASLVVWSRPASVVAFEAKRAPRVEKKIHS